MCLIKILKNIAFTALLLTCAVSVAHTGATGIVKERMDGMKDMSKKSKAVARMFKNKSEFDKALVSASAESFILHGEAMIELFPDTEDSRTGSETRALPSVWENWTEFEKYADKFNNDSALLKDALAGSDDPKLLKSAFMKAVGNCRECHKEFRKREKH